MLSKFNAAHSEMGTIRDFLEWLDAQRIELGTPSPMGRGLMHHFENREAMLMRYLELDPVKLENERRALLARFNLPDDMAPIDDGGKHG